MSAGKCHKCGKSLSYANINALDIKLQGVSKWRGVSYVCPYCDATLGVGIDPIALKTDIVKEVVKALKGQL